MGPGFSVSNLSRSPGITKHLSTYLLCSRQHSQTSLGVLSIYYPSISCNLILFCRRRHSFCYFAINIVFFWSFLWIDKENLFTVFQGILNIRIYISLCFLSYSFLSPNTNHNKNFVFTSFTFSFSLIFSITKYYSDFNSHPFYHPSSFLKAKKCSN